MNANEEKNKELKTPSSLASNVLYNETEYFAFPNIWLIILFVYVVVYPVTINTTSLFLNTIKLNDNWMELISTLFSTIFPLIIISPALLILLESDITILPSFLIQSPAYQRARTFNIVGYGSFLVVDHYVVSSGSATTPTTTQFYLFDVNAYLIIPIWSSIKLYIVAIDVIHSLGFYTFGIKIDAIPGRINPATTSRSLMKGENRGFRSESRGQGHSTMLLISISLIPPPSF